MKQNKQKSTLGYLPPLIDEVKIYTEHGFETSDLDENTPEGGEWYDYV